jgi:hypothetical protein
LPDAQPPVIGRVTRSSIRGFAGGIRLAQPDMPAFGAFCRAEAQQGSSQVVGLIYDISIEGDELARQLAAADSPPPEIRADNQFVRPIPIEISAISIGYQLGEAYIQTLPPQPPLTLADIFPLTASEVASFTRQFDFIPLVLAAAQLPADDLLGAALRQAAAARPEHERRRFLTEAARACARWMAADLNRLNILLQRLQAEPGTTL